MYRNCLEHVRRLRRAAASSAVGARAPDGRGSGSQAKIYSVILVTGATGFMGRALLRQLSESGCELRVMIRPWRRSPRLPKGSPGDCAAKLQQNAMTVIEFEHQL